MLSTFINHLHDNFSTRISAKTSWGKNDLMVEFYRAMVDALTETMEGERKEKSLQMIQSIYRTPTIHVSQALNDCDPALDQGRSQHVATNRTGETCREQEACNEN